VVVLILQLQVRFAFGVSTVLALFQPSQLIQVFGFRQVAVAIGVTFGNSGAVVVAGAVRFRVAICAVAVAVIGFVAVIAFVVLGLVAVALVIVVHSRSSARRRIHIHIRIIVPIRRFVLRRSRLGFTARLAFALFLGFSHCCVCVTFRFVVYLTELLLSVLAIDLGRQRRLECSSTVYQ
jgi:hypothetical protein